MIPQNYRRGRIVALVLVMLLIASYLFIFPGRHTSLPDTPYLLIIQPGVSEQSVLLVRNGLTLADQFLIETSGTTLTTPVEVRVASFSPCSPLKPLPQLGATAQVVGNRLCVNTVDGVWKEALNGKPEFALSVIAHEHYHLLQNELGCLPPPWKKEYDWLIEGGASYVGWETIIASGKISREQVNTLLKKMQAADAPGSLRSYEPGIGGDSSYSLAYQAVQQLVQKTGSLKSLNEFCIRVGQGEEWRMAFAHTFGIALEEFYANFEAMRSMK